MARVRIKAAKRLRDKQLLIWIRSRVAVYKEVKRLELIAREEAERQRLRDLELARLKEEEERRKQAEREAEELRWMAEAAERSRLRKLEDERLEKERLERDRLEKLR